MMPFRLGFLRHGESEGNVANDLLQEGKGDLIPEGFSKIPGWQWPLTGKGRGQAKRARLWMDKYLSYQFDRGYVSWYVRAMETGGLLNYPEDFWHPVYYICERDWGDLEFAPDEVQAEEFLIARTARKLDRVFWKPGNGETLAQATLRVDRFFQTLHRECSNMNVLAVSHGETMLVARMILERHLPSSLQELTEREDTYIGNCNFLEYSRENPFTGKITDHYDWVRLVRPEKDEDPQSLWTFIEHKKYSSADLLKEAAKYKRFFG